MGRPVVDLLDVLYPAAEFALAERRNASSCWKCGALEPVRIDANGCSECQDYPRCGICRRWVGEPDGWLTGYVWVKDDTGADMRCCLVCWKDTK